MPVLNSLVLDHFYIALSNEQVEKLTPLFNDLGGSYQSTQSGKDSWSGLYLHSRLRDYFEVLEQRRLGCLGIALSAVNVTSVDSSKIMTEQPSLPWKKGRRVIEDNQPWFDWYSLVEYENTYSTFFNVWIMDYHKCHFDYAKRPTPKFVDSFHKLVVVAEMNLRSNMIEALQFTDFIIEQSAEKIVLSVPRKDHWPMTFEIHFSQDVIQVKPLKLFFSKFGVDSEVLKKYSFISIHQDQIELNLDI